MVAEVGAACLADRVRTREHGHGARAEALRRECVNQSAEVGVGLGKVFVGPTQARLSRVAAA